MPIGEMWVTHIWHGGVMREIKSAEVTEAVVELCAIAGCELPADVLKGLMDARDNEESPMGRAVLDDIILNAQIAGEERLPICQDTGLAVFFVNMGQEVALTGKNLEEAVNDGVKEGYEKFYLRKSVVYDPLFGRANTGTNTPAIIHLRQIAGDKLEITLAPKGGGCENKSFLRMLAPADGEKGVKRAVVDAVLAAGASACPPFVLGVGIGGNSELAMVNAKRAILRDMGTPHPDPRYAALEGELLELANSTGIGPQGFGGRITALKVNIETAPTHIASLPVAVSISCHAARHASITL